MHTTAPRRFEIGFLLMRMHDIIVSPPFLTVQYLVLGVSSILILNISSVRAVQYTGTSDRKGIRLFGFPQRWINCRVYGTSKFPFFMRRAITVEHKNSTSNNKSNQH